MQAGEGKAATFPGRTSKVLVRILVGSKKGRVMQKKNLVGKVTEAFLRKV